MERIELADGERKMDGREEIEMKNVDGLENNIL